MKKTIFIRTLLATAIMLLFVLAGSGQNDPSDPLVGKWTRVINERNASIDLLSDNTYQVEFAGDEGIDVLGSWQVSGSQITFTDEGGPYSSGTSGTYEYKISGSTVTFKKVDDPVNGRSLLMEGNWSKGGNQ